MRILNTRIHGLLDYAWGILVISLPWILNFTTIDSAQAVAMISGLVVIVYSFCTKYEFGVFKIIPMRIHLWLDFIIGFLMAISPWVFGFAKYMYVPQVLLGIFAMLAALLTRKESSNALNIPLHS